MQSPAEGPNKPSRPESRLLKDIKKRHHRPLTTMYGDNYRYGQSLYSPGVDDVEKRYRNTLSRTHLRSDRGDLGLYTFAGSHLHGGTPAADRGTMPATRSSKLGPDLYAPLNPTTYGKGYYDHLRATTPERKIRSTKPSSYTLPDEPDYFTRPSMVTDYGDDLKKKVTTTTTTESWVPLTTYIYNTPYHTYYYRSTPYSSYTYRSADDMYNYNYVDDYKRSTTTTTTKNVDALDLSVKTSKQTDYKYFSEKCHEIQSQLDQVNKWISDAESKIKTDVVSTRNKMQAELAEVAMIVEDTSKYNEDLQRAIKKQAKQIYQLSSQYEDINRNLVDVSDTLEKSRQRCVTLQSDLTSVQTSLQLSVKRV